MRLPFMALGVALLICFRLEAQVEFENVAGDHIAITIDGQPFSNFFYGPEHTKPFLAPLRSANGLIVTRRWPVDDVESDSHDHPHHRGLFIGFGDVNGVNFWETEPESKFSGENPKIKGIIALARIGDMKPGKKTGSLGMTFHWQTPEKAVLIDEERIQTISAEKDLRLIDIDSTFTAKTDLTFGDTKEGFFAIRVADSISGKKGGLMTSSNGAQTEKDVWGKRADWVDYDGSVDDHKVGIVILDHPGNLRHPPRWHARDYGLFAVNPFGEKEFDPSSRVSGGYLLKAGEQMRFRYRVIIHPGDFSKKKIAELYQAYSKKVK